MCNLVLSFTFRYAYRQVGPHEQRTMETPQRLLHDERKDFITENINLTSCKKVECPELTPALTVQISGICGVESPARGGAFV